MKALFIIAPKDFKHEEYYEPREVLENGGVEVITASLKEEAVSTNGKTEKAVLLENAPTDCDAIIFVGGPGAMKYINDNEKAHSLAREYNQNGKLVCAICISPVGLANAGVLDGKKATVHPSGKADMLTKGIDVQDSAIFVDGNIITANGPLAATEFGNKILEKLR